MATKLNRFLRIGLERFQIHEILLSAVYFIGPERIHEVSEDGNVKKIQTCPIDKGGHAEHRNDPSDQHTIQVGKVRRHHDDCPFRRQVPDLIRLSGNLDFIL